jgi:hypothetical protein
VSRRPKTREPNDVIVRSPDLVKPSHPPPGLVEMVDQLEELAGLLTRGLLSRAEFERQKRKVLGQRWSAR